jgi:hypothetical protein
MECSIHTVQCLYPAYSVPAEIYGSAHLACRPRASRDIVILPELRVGRRISWAAVSAVAQDYVINRDIYRIANCVPADSVIIILFPLYVQRPWNIRPHYLRPGRFTFTAAICEWAHGLMIILSSAICASGTEKPFSR